MISFDERLLRPWRSVKKVERAAGKCLDQCLRALGQSEAPLPVPVDLWIESPLKISFGVEDLSELGENVLGASWPREKKILIHQGVAANEGRYRFTCAHELGHVRLHRKVEQDRHVEKAGEPTMTRNPVEREADRFAGAFLMPAPYVVRELFAACEQHKIKASGCIAELMLDTVESEWLWRKIFLPYLQRRFNVSVAALLFRMRELEPDGKPLLLKPLFQRLRGQPTPPPPGEGIRMVDGVPQRWRNATLWDASA